MPSQKPHIFSQIKRMQTKNKHMPLLLLLIFTVSSLLKAPIFSAADLEGISFSSPSDIAITPKTHVRILNYLPSLTIHCKSKDDDLGVHNLTDKQVYEWVLNPNIWGTTLFFCEFRWGNEKVVGDVYRYNRDFTRCFKMCIWEVNVNAIVGVNSDNQPDVFYPWGK